MKLSRNFYLSELTKTQQRGLDNTPPPDVIERLKLVAIHILQPVRDHYGIAFIPNSGYRSPAVNKAVGGSKTSQHMTGEAVDFEIPGIPNHELACWVRDNLEFDQLILEFYKPGQPSSGWVHCSYKQHGNRKQCLTINSSGTRQGLHK